MRGEGGVWAARLETLFVIAPAEFHEFHELHEFREFREFQDRSVV